MEGPKKRWLIPGLVTTAEPGSSSGRAAFSKGRVGAQSVPETSVISRKELARQYRRQAYQRAKQARATDPKHLAMKEAAKVRRREVYQQVKAQRKVRDAELETKRKAADSQARAVTQRELAQRVRSAIGRGSEPLEGSGPITGMVNESPDELARDIERALQNAELKELMERLRAESPALAAHDRDEVGSPGSAGRPKLPQS